MMEKCNLLNYVIFAGIGCVAYFILKKVTTKRKLDRWKKTPKDLVILHGLPRGKRTPSGSPFVLKLETYLRMTNIPYKFDSTDSFGPTGKTPWISINGEHMSDSEIIMQFLSKKFDKNLNKNYSDDKLAIGTAARVMMEEHIFWGLLRAIFVDETRHDATKEIILPFPRDFFLFMIRRTYLGNLWGQGLGRLSPEQTYGLIQKEIKAFASILGQNKFLLGDEPCELDASAFGFVAQIVWGIGSSLKPYNFLLREYPNLTEYCNRMKSKYWPDWEQCLAR